ncbi:MAG: ammonium transporter, partial [Alcanivoracaceae bacterium]|nr:ammonium transporter [Alcanivoracaceae bacterium]
GITAGCATMAPGYALLTGLIAGIVCVFGQQLLLKMKLDDVVGAVAVHGFAGAWGTLAAGIFFIDDPFNSTIILVQLIGVISAFAWAFVCAFVLYLLIAAFVGLRASAIHEQRGLDLSEHAEIGYPEFPVDTAYTAARASDVETR